MLSLRRIHKDHYGAALMILIGTAVVTIGSGYHVGHLTHMGAGFMPVLYGSLLIAVGVLLGLGARPAGPAAAATPQWRGWACILGGVAAFVLLGRHGGLLPATFASVFVAALGDRQNSLRDAALLALAMTVASELIFSLALRLPLPAFTWG